MNVSKRERLRNGFCKPPRYPGKPADYIYVEPHCRRKIVSSLASQKQYTKLDRYKDIMSSKDLTIAALLTRVSEIPKFILHAVKSIKQGKSYKNACETWKGKINFEKINDVKATVMALTK